MYAVEFQTKITDGKIDIPDEYLLGLSSDVKIIILCEHPLQTSMKPISNQSKSIKGIVRKYANPSLVPFEKEAWGASVEDKHVIN